MASPPQERSGTPRDRKRGGKAFLGTWQGEVGMGFNRYAGALLASAAGLGVSLGVTASFAADMPLKAPPPVVEPLDMHAFFDASFKNAYITPRGLLVTNTGLTTQILAGLAGDVYKSKTGFTYDVELGIVPTLDMKRYLGIPLTLSAPTWVTVGPSDYWNVGGNKG